jgi:hypothetical protein
MKHADDGRGRTWRRFVPRMARRAAVLTSAAIVVLAGAGIACAYFISSGSGTAAASTGALKVSIASTAGTPRTPLLPGGPAGDVTLQVDNPNAFAVTLISVVGDGTITASTGCTDPDVTFANQTGLQVNIPANSTNYQVDLPGAATLGASSPNDCQGATFSIPVTITVES